MPDQTAELLRDAKASLGEGPIWDPSEERLYWVDIVKCELHGYDPETGKDTADQVGQSVGCVVPRNAGGVMLALKHAFAAFDPATSNIGKTVYAPNEPASNRFNDGKCDPAGRFWAGTIGKAGSGKLYRLDTDFSVHAVLDDITCSNGLVWNAAKDTVYYIDTPTLQVAAFDYDNETGAISNRRVAIEVPRNEGVPDGMAIDAEDKLWVAHWGGSQVIRWDPESGQALARIKVPASQTTACAFGGKDLDRLYITSARTGLDEARLEKEPHAGGLFIADPGVSGAPTYAFAG